MTTFWGHCQKHSPSQISDTPRTTFDPVQNLSSGFLPHRMSFAAFSHAMRNRWKNPCISHAIKHTIRWGSDGREPLILWEKYGYQFPRLSPKDGFCYIFPYYGILEGIPVISHGVKYSIRYYRCTHTLREVCVQIS